jgi:hypothetical protein
MKDSPGLAQVLKKNGLSLKANPKISRNNISYHYVSQDSGDINRTFDTSCLKGGSLSRKSNFMSLSQAKNLVRSNTKDINFSQFAYQTP